MKTIIAFANYFKDNSIVMQFIPIALILFYATSRYTFSKISHSILGKLFAVMLILYYTRIDFIYGTICCVAVILYYQRTEIEGFADDELNKDKKDKKEIVESVEDGTNLPPLDDSEGFETFEKSEPSIISIDQFNVAKDEFIKEKCKNGVLMYKDFPVKSEMADHVYSEIKYNTKSKCNPCDRTCDYNIIEAKLETDKKIMAKSSNDLFDAFKKFFGTSEAFEPNSATTIGYSKL